MHKCWVNENFFDHWTKESAWIFGFILADGCIYSDPRTKTLSMSLQIQLKDTDSSLLEVINKALESNYKIVKATHYNKITKKTYKKVRLHISNTNLCRKLMTLGIDQRKSGKEKYPTSLPDNLFWHFLRGYSDGDGCITITNDQIGFYLSGGMELLQQVQHTINAKLNLENGSLNYRNGTGELRFKGNKLVPKILEKLYENSNNIRLERKYKTFITRSHYE